MYIKNIAIGSEDNVTNKMLAYLDMDTMSLPNVDPLFPQGDTRVINVEISERNMTDDLKYIGLGNVLDDRYSIFPFKIDFTNSTQTGQSMPKTQYTEVDILSETPPENWDLEKWTYYYVLRNDGTNDKRYTMLQPDEDWETLRQSLIANDQKLYYNDQNAKWVWIGNDTAKICFILGRHGQFGRRLGNAIPVCDIFTRNCLPVNDNYNSRTGGYIRAGNSPDSPKLLSTAVMDALCYTQISNKTSISSAFTSGRFSTNDQYDNPITECSLMQFGIIKYNGKEYFGVFRVLYETKYYWGYPLRTGTTWNYRRLDFDNPVSYDSTMTFSSGTGQFVYPIQFSGICLDDFDIEIETEEGEIPPETDPDGNYNYPSFSHRFLNDQSFGILANATSAGFHVYRLTSSEFNKLASKIWNWGNIVNTVLTQIEDKGLIKGAIDAATSSIIQSKLSPSDCIVFARKMPHAVTNPPAGILDSLFSLRLGGQYLDVQGNAYLAERIVRTVATNWQFTGPTQTFLDMGSNVSVSVMLPYVGSVQIPADAVMDGHLDISYAFDIISGQCGVQIITTARDGRQQTYGTYTGAPSVNIPLAIADSNITGRQIATARAAVNGVVGAIKGYSTGGLIGRGGVASNLIGAAAAIAEEQAAPADFNRVTSLGTDSAIISPCDIMIQITYPATVDLQNTINLIGACAYKTGRVADFVSPEMDKPARFSYIDTDGITATADELAMIEQALKEGVYL